jgi:hypothetical protein
VQNEPLARAQANSLLNLYGLQFANPGSHDAFRGSLLLANYLHAVPLTANDVGTALAVLFQVPLNPMPL